MSKCGMCGVDFGSGSHMVLSCKATLTDELDDRIKEWLIMEPTANTKVRRKEKDLKEATSILAEITRRYNNRENGGNQ